MKNIWRIFSGDMKRLVRNPFALVIAILYFLIISNNHGRMGQAVSQAAVSDDEEVL